MSYYPWKKWYTVLPCFIDLIRSSNESISNASQTALRNIADSKNGIEQSVYMLYI